MTFNQSITQLSNDIAQAMQNRLKINKSIRTGDLYSSIKPTTKGADITISMLYYGQFLDEGHRTRAAIRTDKTPTTRRAQVKLYVKARPFIAPGIDDVINKNLPVFVDNVMLNIFNKK